MMKTATYQKLVYVAYGFFIVLGLAWYLLGIMNDSRYIQPFSFFIVLAFGLQAYYRHLLTNLILGILALFFSIFMMLLPSLNYAIVAAQRNSFTWNAFFMIATSILSVALSGILIFSYMKLNFRD